MHFLVFGATGRTGRAFVDRALAAGHQVSALVRSPAPDLPAAVTLHIGEVTHAETVAALIHPEHTLIVTLGRVDALTVGTANILRAAESAGARRLLGVAGAGILPVDVDSTQMRSDLPTYPPHLRPIGAAHRAFYDAARASTLDWTLACAPNIVGGAATGAYLTQPDVLPAGTGSITTGDLAAFLLEEAERCRFVRARVGIAAAR